MKHQIGGTGWPSHNIGLLDFHAGLPKGWDSNTFENGDCDLSLGLQEKAESVILFN